MPRGTLAQRVMILEQKVEQLQTLPARIAAVELQILQLRDEMRSEFSAVRRELTDLFRTELQTTAESLGAGIRAEIRQGDEETRRYMRVLHEDVIARIAALGEARR
jgi:hypothetical protein